MKLNQLILVICTGILVGFSACKKDPFTEADAIAAQKELITMKYGYELQLKNIEAAIQKAHDDAAIAMKNLEIKGASDLEKQKAAQQIAYLLAQLQAERDDYAWRQKFDDSVDVALAKRTADAAAAAAIAAAYNALATTYNATLRMLENGVAVSGATVKILRFDNTYFTATSDANGYIFVKNEKFISTAPATITVTNTSKAIYPIIYTTPAGLFGSPNGSYPLLSYNPTTLDSIKGALYVPSSLTSGSSTVAGAGYLITASTSVGSNGTLPGDTTTTKLSFVTSTLATGDYLLPVPKTGGSISSYTVSAPKSITTSVTGYTLSGSNPYQALPSIATTSLVVSPGTTLSTSFDNIFNASYFLSLPNSDHPGGYSVTLTDPLLAIPQLLSQISVGGGNTPTGVSAAGTTLDTSFKWSLNPNVFLLNNGHLDLNMSADTNVYYDLPSITTFDSTAYLAYMALPIGVAGDQDSTTKTGVKYLYLQDLVNDVPNATWTPTIATSTTYGNDTLAVSFIDLTGAIELEDVEFVAIVTPVTNTNPQGKVTAIQLIRGESYGKFSISAVFSSNASGSIRYPRVRNYKNSIPGTANSGLGSLSATSGLSERTSITASGGGSASFTYGKFSISSFKGVTHNATAWTTETVANTDPVQYNATNTTGAALPWKNNNATKYGGQTISASNYSKTAH